MSAGHLGAVGAWVGSSVCTQEMCMGATWLEEGQLAGLSGQRKLWSLGGSHGFRPCRSCGPE